MKALEREHAGRDIRDIVLDTLVNNETDKEAANDLDIDNSTLSMWIAKLGLLDKVAAIRRERGDL